MKPMKRYEFIEHTADIGVKAYGKNLDEIFENAAVGMFNIMTDTSRVESLGEYRIELVSPDVESLLVDWLTELLYLEETQDVLFGDFEVKVEGRKLVAKARGEKIDRKKHPLKMDVKAVTYHMLEINEKKGYATILFDI